MSDEINYTREQWVQILEALRHYPENLDAKTRDLLTECNKNNDAVIDLLNAALRALGDRAYRRALLPFVDALKQEAEHCRVHRGGVFKEVEPNTVEELLAIAREFERWCLGEPVTWEGDGGTVSLRRVRKTWHYAEEIETFDEAENWLWAALVVWRNWFFRDDNGGGKGGDDDDDGGVPPTPSANTSRRRELIDA
jgi:hypothetical protein